MKQTLFPSTSRSRIPRREGNSTTSNTSKTKKKGREEQGTSSSSDNRNPFQDLSNGGSLVDVSSSMGTIGSSSSVSSIEAPRGCLRFFLNHSAASTSKPQFGNRNNSNHQRPAKVKSMPCKTHKTAHNSRPSKENFETVKGIPSACLYKRQSGKNPKPSSGISRLDTVGNTVSKLEISGSGDRGCDVEKSNSTPLRMIVAGSGLDVTVSRCKEGSSLNSNSSSNSKTPPLHASVSPEIQQPCHSSAISTAATDRSTATTPVCYGAGHLLSGVTDKRKCRPRGLLVVGEAKPVDKLDIDDDNDADDDVILDDGKEINHSPSSFPVKASMHWLLSPVNKENECSSGNGGAQNTGERTRRASSSVTSSDMDISPPEEKITGCAVEDRSPFSMDLLCSVNLVQTPESDSGKKAKEYNCGWGFELDSVDQHWPPSTSFRFDLPTTAPHSVVDLSRFQNPLAIRESQLSTSTFDDMSHSGVRISWRDGLVSRIFEMDELDCCCKCLSDEEEDDFENEPRRAHKLDLDIESSRTSNVCIAPSSDGKARDVLPAKVSCDLPAESMNISTDGGALFQSDDSDWTQCYKNQLFQGIGMY